MINDGELKIGAKGILDNKLRKLDNKNIYELEGHKAYVLAKEINRLLGGGFYSEEELEVNPHEIIVLYKTTLR